MPPRGRHRAKTGAINYGLGTPSDLVQLWECKQGHWFFTIGPVVAYEGLILVQVCQSGLMTGSHGVRRVLCGCLEPWCARVPIKHELQCVLRATVRIDGEEGLQHLLVEEYKRHVSLPYFRVSDGDEIGRNFPESPMEGLTHADRYVRGGVPWDAARNG